MSEAIARCPFCNGSATQHKDITNGKYQIICDSCQIYQDGFILKEESIAHWNTRVKSPPAGEGLVPIDENKLYDLWFDKEHIHCIDPRTKEFIKAICQKYGKKQEMTQINYPALIVFIKQYKPVLKYMPHEHQEAIANCFIDLFRKMNSDE